ncbi:MAG: hypothetical protein ACLGJB_00065 [Blastocatellia bacterium]
MFGIQLFGIVAIILDIFALTDVMKSNRDTFSKVVLMALILMVPIFAAGIYLLVFRDRRYAV